MSTPRPKSRCAHCHRTMQKHVCGDRLLCPDGSARVFEYQRVHRPSNSFDAREVDWLADVFDALQRRKAWRLAQLTARRELLTVARKVLSMRRGAAARRETV